MKNILDPGDLEEALGAANAIGDDRLQKQGRGYVVPDSFTHGTSAQRVRWFRLGFETGDMSRAMDLFKLDYSELSGFRIANFGISNVYSRSANVRIRQIRNSTFRISHFPYRLMPFTMTQSRRRGTCEKP